MKYFFIKTILIVSFLLLESCVSTKVKTEGQKAIESFYQSYFETLSDTSKPKPSLNFSKNFSELIALNRAICKEKAGSDNCGWDILHGDDYLNAQELDADLNYENSQFKTFEPKLNLVRVEFNVFPSAKENKKQYNRAIEYLMIREDNNLVVDDIITDGQSLRKLLSDEIEKYRGTQFHKINRPSFVAR